MPKPLHERLRDFIPERLRERIPEAMQPPAWRAPVQEPSPWAKDEAGQLEWVPGDRAETVRDVVSALDSKGKKRPEVRLPAGTPGRITAVGPDFVVFQWTNEPGVRLPKKDVGNLVAPKERRWAEGE